MKPVTERVPDAVTTMIDYDEISIRVAGPTKRLSNMQSGTRHTTRAVIDNLRLTQGQPSLKVLAGPWPPAHRQRFLSAQRNGSVAILR